MIMHVVAVATVADFAVVTVVAAEGSPPLAALRTCCWLKGCGGPSTDTMAEAASSLLGEFGAGNRASVSGSDGSFFAVKHTRSDL